MTLRGPIPDHVLNAYVDGALAPDMAAAIASRASAEPALAARIIRLHGLKAGVAGLIDTLPPAPPLPLPAARPRHPVRRFWPAAVAAGLALAFVGLATLGAGPARGPAPDHLVAGADDLRGVVAQYQPIHDAWVDAADASPPGTADWLTDAMAEAGLRLVHAAPLPDGRGMHLAFIGRNACRISLFERHGSGVARGVIRRELDDVHAASWHTGTSAFTLIAREMNSERFITITEALAAASLTRDRTDPALLAALAMARQPCLG